MNRISETSAEDFPDGIAANLDPMERVPTDALYRSVSRDGACGWVRTTGEEPQWTGDDAADRELTAPICGRCPVQRECLELEFRTAGCATAGVWGPLPEHERRTAYLAWADRRDGGQR